MKRTYEKPTLVKVGNLPLVTAIFNGHNGGGGISPDGRNGSEPRY